MTAHEDFSTLFERLPIGAYRCTAEGKLLRANAALVRLCRATSEDHARIFVNEDQGDWYLDTSRREQFRKALFETGEVVRFESEVRLATGAETRWISENAHLVKDSAGKVLYYEGTIEDITEQRHAQQALDLAFRRYQALTSKSQSASIVCSADGQILFASEAVNTLLGYSANDMVGTNLFDTMHPEDLAEHRAEFARVALNENSGQESVARHLHADGTWRFLASLASDAREDDAVGGLIVYWRDVTETHMARLRLRTIAETDSLTGLVSRAQFERTCVERLEARFALETPSAIFFIDLDNFKFANDSYGHWVGDQILIASARRLRELCQSDELVARIGGDEFAVFTAGEHAKHPEAFAASIVRLLSHPIKIGAIQFEVSASVGVACCPRDSQQFDELLRFADQAMFEAKAQSRNTYCVFTLELERRAREQSNLITDLRHAINLNEFIVFYQPQVDMASGELLGVEALVRWNHPARGIVAPDEFIRVAEEQGLISAIGLQVLQIAVPQIAKWRKVTGRALRLAINVSARQLRDRTLGAKLFELLSQHDLPPEALEIEVTESILIEASREGRDLLAEMRALGLRIVLDDLGVGYSSMAYLRQFPVDGVKIDRGFVEGLPFSAVDMAIVRSIISLARELNLSIVAEGVEVAAQRTHLLSENCITGQGFLFARPLPADLFETQGWLDTSLH